MRRQIRRSDVAKWANLNETIFETSHETRRSGPESNITDDKRDASESGTQERLEEMKRMKVTYGVSGLGRVLSLVMLCLTFAASYCNGQAQPNTLPPTSGSKVLGEVKLDGVSKVEKESGVWVDGNYVGYLKELKGDKKLLLLPGEHEIAVRQSGYDDFVQKVVVEPGQVHTVVVRLTLSPRAVTPDVTATLKLDVQPGRAAVFLDGKFVGHASEFGGVGHSMLISPGKHRIKVELPGYRTFETEVNLLVNQKSEVKTELVKGSIEQAGPEIKQPQ
jgi:PEGA domain